MRPFTRVLSAIKNRGVIGIARAVVIRAARLPIQGRAERASARSVAIAQSGMSARDKFEAIYRERIWADAAPTLLSSASLSGHGSTEQFTRVFRNAIAEFIRQESIASLFDAPCGDFHWMRLMEFPNGFRYIGGDIATSVIENLKSRFSFPDRQFIPFDITLDLFPDSDAWLCKDCLQHLSFEDIAMALHNFTNSNVQWALISNHTDVETNHNIATGDFRHLDLTKPPFNLPPPREILSDKPVEPVDDERRGVFVWRREDIPVNLPDQLNARRAIS